MSHKESVSREQIEAALRGALEAVLPALVEDVLARLGEKPAPRNTRARRIDLAPLFEAARSGGEPAVRRVVDEMDDIIHLASTIDRTLGSRARRAKDLTPVRADIVAEILRRAVRNDVFLEPAGGRSKD